MNIYTVSDLMKQAAIALSEGGFAELVELREIVQGWEQTGEEREAQCAMLDAMIEAIE